MLEIMEKLLSLLAESRAQLELLKRTVDTRDVEARTMIALLENYIAIAEITLVHLFDSNSKI